MSAQITRSFDSVFRRVISAQPFYFFTNKFTFPSLYLQYITCVCTERTSYNERLYNTERLEVILHRSVEILNLVIYILWNAVFFFLINHCELPDDQHARCVIFIDDDVIENLTDKTDEKKKTSAHLRHYNIV